ncbi:MULTISPECIES: alpha/beta hydrolase [unclassified Streptomyces]|uniref:alpha/beta hydrolase family protein n=1 Tax=unclassified Streptomyces TaxID=2593676 RepID=UPI002DD8BD4E|nr:MULTISPECIES: alpha/beta hydrolase [unclassified Streptomyces]WSA93471.1 alpha/beta hydrolase [Streptomyces sp. NBC_01795]WSB77840.1 alpha/beta hydrolase [Streptomyces sp. NBC_01775]WSS13912.1 alpha/beta hydrolase [Streptomyces sp. NBC_01186]WSS42726.1 alpha/beta hydrolase [Streptomyces sp. NBC_01187]
MSDAECKALLALEPVGPESQERYGPHPSQVIDLYGVGGTGKRIVVLHGGFWREGWDRTHLSPFAAALAGQGMSVALVEYRRVGGDGGWPSTVEDVDAALEHLGAPPSVLVGHSSGGQLALWAASKRARAAGRVVAVAPVADLERAHDLSLSEGSVAEFLGGEDKVAAAMPDADPMRLLPRIPVEILHGTADLDVPIELSRRYANNWGGRLHLLPGVGHYAPLTPRTPAFDVLASSLR